jgi:hypothetical protein
MTMRIAALVILATAGIAHADDKELDKASVIYARGAALYRSDARGKGEVELAALPGKAPGVRALRTDAKGTVLLADVDGKWLWMPLDGSKKALSPLPCGDGPAQIAQDGLCVVCRAPSAPTRSVVINLFTGRQIVADIPTAGTRVVGAGLGRRLVWAEKNGIWSAPTADPRKKTLLAPEPPLRAFLPSNDGAQAIGVYGDFVYEGKVKTPAEVLMTFALDGQGARRKGIKTGVPLEWSHDNQYVLVQDGASACLMRAGGGQYKCWKGFTAVSIAPDGSYALVLGNRDGSRTLPKAPAKAPAKPAKAEPVDEDPSTKGAPVADDVPVALPTGPLALYRAKLDGVYEAPPALVVKIVDGAAVWVPGK